MKKLLIFSLLFITITNYAQFAPVPSFFRTQRALPLVELNTTQTILVSNYGAKINDGLDDIAGITAAINAAVSIATIQNPVRLVFDNGTYDLMPTSGTHSLSMTDATGVLWDGQNAQFMVHNPKIGFLRLLRCANTIIKDISIDYVTLPFSQGRVTKVDVAGGFFEFRVDDGFPLPVETHFVDAPQRWGMFKNAKGGIKEGTANLISHNQFFELIGTRTYRYGAQSSNSLANAAVGDYFVHIGRYNGATIIENNGGKNLTYLNVIGYASPAGGFNGRNSEEWNVINCQLKLKPGRVQTTNADAMHINGGKIGPWVEGSLFEGFSDDCMNIKYTKRDIRTVHSSTEITIVNRPEDGEVLEFYNPRDGVFLGSATVSNIRSSGNNLFRINLSNPINITLVNDIEHQSTDKAYAESLSNESLIFRNNIVRNSRRYGLLIQSKYALVENNLFQNLSGSAIKLENGVDWNEGFRADNIEIRNNRIENCGYDRTYIIEESSAAISIDFAKLKSPCPLTNTGFCGTETTNWRAHRNIRIIDNTILYNKRGMYLKNMDGLTITNNFLCHRDEDVTLTNNEAPIEITNINNANVSTTSHNYQLPNPNIQFLLNEPSTATNINNSGSNQTIGLQINNQNNTIQQGFFDTQVGNVFKINTTGNGFLRLINTNDNTAFLGPVNGAARTYTFWLKPEQAIFQTIMFSGGPTAGQVFSIQMLANRVLRITDNNANTVSMTDMPLDIGVWNHIAITVPENNSMFSIQLYKNGVASNEVYSGNNVLIKTASNSVDFFSTYKGLASDIRYFDYKLCGSQIESVFNDKRTTTLSIDDFVYEGDKIKVYPAIVSNTLFFSKIIESVSVFNLLGQVFIQEENIEFSELDVSHLTSGMYIIKINGQQTSKFYKN